MSKIETKFAGTQPEIEMAEKFMENIPVTLNEALHTYIMFFEDEKLSGCAAFVQLNDCIAIDGLRILSDEEEERAVVLSDLLYYLSDYAMEVNLPYIITQFTGDDEFVAEMTALFTNQGFSEPVSRQGKFIAAENEEEDEKTYYICERKTIPESGMIYRYDECTFVAERLFRLISGKGYACGFVNSGYEPAYINIYPGGDEDETASIQILVEARTEYDEELAEENPAGYKYIAKTASLDLYREYETGFSVDEIREWEEFLKPAIDGIAAGDMQ